MTANLTYLLNQNNYGQRLQTYALQRFMEDDLGEKVVTIDFDEGRRSDDINDNKYFHKFERECLNLVNIRGFDIEYLDRFDHIVVGGDQVLNTDYGSTWNILKLLNNIRHKRRNVFYYGAGLNYRHVVDQKLLSSEYPQVIAYGTRENCNNADFVRTLDPVLMIIDRWKNVASFEPMSGGTVRYVVERGEMKELSRTDAAGNIVFHAVRGVEVPDPRTFVGIFAGADKTITNSFHGFCFALMNRIPEIVVTDQTNRVSSLKELLAVKEENGKVVNYDEIFYRIEEERKKSLQFVSRCLNSSPVDYCAYAKDDKVRNMSSSGGVALELARTVLAEGGSVFGGAFSSDFRKVVPKCVHSIDEYKAVLSKSKYSFCSIPKLEDVRSELKSGRQVMYIGSPCHVCALKKMLGDVPTNLICVDFRCRGYSRPDKLCKFVDKLESNGCKVKELDFRPGHRMAVLAKLSSGATAEFGSDEYRKFVFDSIPMCRSCRFAHGYLSDADITVGDFWYNSKNNKNYGQDFTPEAGCNILSVNTKAGEALWDKSKTATEHRPLIETCDMTDCKIWVTYHKDRFIDDYKLRNTAVYRLFPSHREAKLENLNYMNPVWSELVTIWYVYHNNIRSDYVGFAHYRRRLSPSRVPARGECAIFNKSWYRSIYDHYDKSHNIKDMDIALRYLDEKYGAGNKYSEYIRHGHDFVLNMCFMLCWDDFVSLCEFLFPIIEHVSKETGCGLSVDMWRKRAQERFKGADEGAITYQTRAVSFFAERLVSAYIVNNFRTYY